MFAVSTVFAHRSFSTLILLKAYLRNLTFEYRPIGLSNIRRNISITDDTVPNELSNNRRVRCLRRII